MAPVSPVKRVTRARAAAKKSTDSMKVAPKKPAATKAVAANKTKLVHEEPAVNIEETKDTNTVTTPVLEIASIKAAPRRRVKVTPLDAVADHNITTAETIPEVSAAKKKSARTKKDKKDPDEKQVQDTVAEKQESKTTKTRATAKTKNTIEAKKAEEVPVASKTRGRPKKTQPTATNTEAVEKPKRNTRTRANSGPNVEESISEPVTAAKVGPRKKVTFQDVLEHDKENQPLKTTKLSTKKVTAEPTTGIRARPVRKPAAASGRRKPASESKKEENSTTTQVLTPKKITQVARSSTPDVDDEEDELSGAKTPIRDLSQSPKRMPDFVKTQSPVKKLDFTSAVLQRSPEKPSDSASLMSPPRRPPQSPLKNILKASPKRGEAIHVFNTSSNKLEGHVFNATASPSTSTLRQSPKRGIFDSSMFTESMIQSHKSPEKPTLMQSPVKRYPSPKKQQLLLQHTSDTDAEMQDEVISSHFRASKSPERSLRVYNVSEEDNTLDASKYIDFDQSILDVRSPLKAPKSATTLSEMIEMDENVQDAIDAFDVKAALPAASPSTRTSSDATHVFPEQVGEVVPESMDDVLIKPAELHNIFMSSVTPEIPPVTAVPSALSHFRDGDESSEDELQSPEKPLLGTQLSTLNQNTKVRHSTGIAGQTRKSLGFTPLAKQFSGWSASSPQKYAINPMQPLETFSPIATQHVDGEVQVSRQSTPLQRKIVAAEQSSTPVYGSAAKKLSTSRTSLASSVSHTPQQGSHFADEMAAKDLEDLIETQDFANGDRAGDIGAFSHQILASTEGSAMEKDATTINIDDATEDLTTDLVQDNKMSDTAMLDFAQIASEAEELAPHTYASQISTDSSVYGDENIPREEEVAEESVIEQYEEIKTQDVQIMTDSPLPFPIGLRRTATPARPLFDMNRLASTVVSKVPLKPEGQISPIKVVKKRSLSLSQGSDANKRPCFDVNELEALRSTSAGSVLTTPQVQSPVHNIAVSTPGQKSFAIDDFGDSTLDGIELPDDEIEADEENIHPARESSQTPKVQATTPMMGRPPLQAVGKGILHGAIVHVDVHTTEGADASSIFIELLTQMGAKCVKEWKWNPRTSTSSEDVASTIATPARIGITHVVYKDGGKRTLEKVRDAKGEVWCVGVGWVLDCERQNQWLDESNYVVDPAILPRGGSRRRKSMEPRTLINMNGSIAKGRRSISAEMTREIKEELINTPVRRPEVLGELKQTIVEPTTVGNVNVPSQDENETFLSSNFDDDGEIEFTVDVTATTAAAAASVMATPTGQVNYDPSMSPNTPYFLAKGKQLVQMTCPPKQINRGLFETMESGNESRISQGEKENDGGMRKRLEAARRKSMNWRPRVASPLGK